MTVALRPHQVTHADALAGILARHASALDASDTGTGKTYTALAVAQRLGVTPLVICPKSVTATWVKVGRDMGLDVEAVGYERARGSKKDVGGRRVHCSDWGLEVPFGRGSSWRWKQPVELAIFDEVHRCGAVTSLQSKLLIAARRQFGKLLLLSATAADDPVRMKALGFALDLFPTSEFRFWLLRNGVKPGVWGGFEFGGTTAQQNRIMERLHGLIFPVRGARMRKAEIPGFPRTTVEPKYLTETSGKADQLCREIRQLYLRHAEAAQLILDENTEETSHKHLEAMLRRRQALELLKVPDLVELALDYAQSSRVVIFAHFRETLEQLQTQLQKTYEHVPIIDGRNSAVSRGLYQQHFQENRLPVLLCNAEAGGIALSLHDPTGQVERTALVSPGWSARQFLQTLGRVHRDGGAFSQQFIVGFADTLEEDIIQTLAERANRIDLLNDGIMHGIIQ